MTRLTIADINAIHSKYTVSSVKETGKKRSKYGNIKTQVNGITFASKLEANRYIELRTLEQVGEITELRWQVPFPLKVEGDFGTWKAKYIADFAYVTREGRRVVEDAKGVKTREYQIKKGLMAVLHGIEIVEIRRGKRRGNY